MKPHVKLAFSLVLFGSGLIALERYGLAEWQTAAMGSIDSTLLSVMLLVPVGLIVAGGLVFVIGAMRRR